MFYFNTIEQLFLFVEQLDQLEVCLPYSKLLAGIPILAVFKNLRWNSNKTSLGHSLLWSKKNNNPSWTWSLFGDEFEEVIYKHIDDTLNHFNTKEQN